MLEFGFFYCSKDRIWSLSSYLLVVILAYLKTYHKTNPGLARCVILLQSVNSLGGQINLKLPSGFYLWCV